MMTIPKEYKNSQKYKLHNIWFSAFIDQQGHAFLDTITTNSGGFPTKEIKDFIESNLFDTSHMPPHVDRWEYKGKLNVMNKSLTKARKEKKIEIREKKEKYKRDIVADSINGFYIPKNLDECPVELDKLIGEEMRNEVRSADNVIKFHMSLGMWIRNNWGLWSGSRLQIYFQENGTHHPDEMSSIILSTYKIWLENNDKN